MKAGCSIADIAAGMYAYSNILAALLQRQQTGRGAHLDISMLESLVEWMSYPLYYAFAGAAPPPPAARATRRSIPTAHSRWRWQDSDAGPAERARVDRVLREGAATTRARRRHALHQQFERSAARDELRHMIIEVFAQLSAAEVVQRLDDAQIANAGSTTCTTWGPCAVARTKRWRDVESPAGSIPALLPPGSSQVANEASARMDPVPALGAHRRLLASWVAQFPNSPSCVRRTPFECSH